MHKYKLNKTYPSKAQILHDCGVSMFVKAFITKELTFDSDEISTEITIGKMKPKKPRFLLVLLK